MIHYFSMVGVANWVHCYISSYFCTWIFRLCRDSNHEAYQFVKSPTFGPCNTLYKVCVCRVHRAVTCKRWLSHLLFAHRGNELFAPTKDCQPPSVQVPLPPGHTIFFSKTLSKLICLRFSRPRQKQRTKTESLYLYKARRSYCPSSWI